MAGFERPPQNIEVLVHLVCRLIILKIVTKNVKNADYQTKNAIREKNHHTLPTELDGDTTSEPFWNKVPIFELLRD